MGNRSALGLDGVNFFIAAVQTGFGAFVTVYLVKSQWSPEDIGFALTISTLSTLFSQLPAGAYIDAIADKRKAVLLGISGVGLAASLLCVTAAKLGVYLAMAFQGLGSSLISPGIAAISLALVGQARLSERIGRNARFASIGNGLAAGVMGIAGSYLPAVSMFLVAALLVAPALLSLLLIRPEGDIQPVVASQSGDEARITLRGMKSLLLNRQLVIFGVCVVLFFASSAALGPGFAGQVTRLDPGYATLIVAVTILLPQAIVATISPWIGRQANILGRRPLLLVGWGLLPLQAALYAIVPGPYTLFATYLLNAVSGAVFGVMMTVVAADLTRRMGYFNLTLGALGVAVSIGASMSTFFAGLVAGQFSARTAAFGLALVGGCGWLLVWIGMPETLVSDRKESAERQTNGSDRR